MTPEQAIRLLQPPPSDLLYERAISRLTQRKSRSRAQRRELTARRLPDGSYPVPIRWDPTITQHP